MTPIGKKNSNSIDHVDGRTKQAVSQKELKNFGLLVGGILLVIGLWPMLLRGESLRVWAVGVGGLLIGLGGLYPQTLAPIHKGWMWVGHLLGWINTRILPEIGRAHV